jgi:glycosyltransferase involved in cell wall biosynthesis
MVIVSERPVVSVVVATHDRADMLCRLVGSLEVQQDVGPFEVVVVDDASRDATWSVLQDLAGSSRVPIVPFRLARNAGPATARNVGWRAARAEMIAFTDDDCIPQPGWLRLLVQGLSDFELVQGWTTPIPEREAGRGPFARSLWIHEEDGRYQTCNIAYRRAILERLGGFDEGFRSPYGEDADLAWRAKELGARSSFEPAAIVHHEVYPSSYRAYLGDTKRRSGVVRAVGRHPGLRDHLHSRWFYRSSHPPALLAALGIGLAVAGSRSSRWWGSALLLGLPYLRHRLVVDRLPCRPQNQPAAIGLALVADLAEIGVLVKSSIRYRTLVL